MSTAVAAILSVGVFAGMQLYRHQLAASGPLTLLGGFLASLLFIFVLTVSPCGENNYRSCSRVGELMWRFNVCLCLVLQAVGNLELMLFGPGFQTSLTEGKERMLRNS